MPDSAAFWSAFGTIALAICGALGTLAKYMMDRIRALEELGDKRQLEHDAYREKKQAEYIEMVKQIAALYEAKTAAERHKSECEERLAALEKQHRRQH